ncbi:MAG: glycosyltransferase family 2 protein [Verrucomicrobiae bacterium]|nr:glycosyltransferase family 2 protein [Verrucomicrobiae bacterium]
MYQGQRIAVVIPAYREAARVADVVRGLPPWVDHIVVVDDASDDGTAEAAASANDARLLVLRHGENQGVGGATITGFNKACELGATVLVKMDGDGQMDPAQLPALLGPICRGEADFTKGNRFLHARQLQQMPLLRRLGNIGLSFLAKLASGYWNVFDPTNGFVAIHASVWKMLDQGRLARRFFFENSLLLELGLARAVVRDVYVPARYNDKVSHLSEGRTLLEFPPLLLRGLCRRLVIQYFVRDFNAVSLFLITGTTATAFGLGWGLYHWRHSVLTGTVATTGTVMIAVLPLIFGVQLLLQALVMDVQSVPRDPLHLGQCLHQPDTTGDRTDCNESPAQIPPVTRM